MQRAYLFVFLFFGLFFEIRDVFAQESPMQFLSSFLQKEFEGKAARVGKVIFTDGKGETVGDCDCLEPRELFDVDTSPLLIVSKWETGEALSSSKHSAIIQARFYVLAETEGDGVPSYITGRKILPLSNPRDETISYRLKEKAGQWFVVDPPLPRVNIDVVRDVLDERIEAKRKILKTKDDLSQDIKILHEKDRDEYLYQKGLLEELKNCTALRE